MKLFPYLIFLIFSFPGQGNALQQYSRKDYKDSLTYLLTQQITDSIKARAGFLLADEWSYTDTLKAKQFLEQARKFSGKNKYLQGLYYFYGGQVFFEIDKRQAEKLYLKADSLLGKFETAESYYFRAKAWHNYGACRQHDDDSKTMLAVLINKAIPLAIKSGNKEYLATNYADVGLIFMNQWQYDKAATYYDKAISILKLTTQTKPGSTGIYIDAVSNLLYMDNLVDAKKLIEITRPMVKPGTDLEIGFYSNEAIYYRKSKQYAKSLSRLDKALSTANKLENDYLVEGVMFLKYKSLTAMGNYGQAKNVLLHIVNNKTMKFNQNSLMHYDELAQTFVRLGDMKSAYKWQKEYSTLLDSTSKRQLNKEINALEIKFHNSENQKRIGDLNTANIKAKLEAKNTKLLVWLTGSASLFLFATVISILFFYRNDKRSSAQKAQIKLTKAMVKAQDVERTRVARDLHDGLGGMLTMVKLNLEDFAHENRNVAVTGLTEIVSQLSGSVKELRRISHNMMPEMLLQQGLEASLNDLCKLQENKNLHVDFQFLNIQSSMLTEEQITIYRIIQELLANVVKHSGAKNVYLQCAQHGSLFFITIEDDGKGFAVDPLTQVHGIGLNNIRSRVAYLQGKIEFLSAEQQGTSINIELNVTSAGLIG